MSDDAELLHAYIDTWWEAVNDFTKLLETLEPADWQVPTELPGWSVHDVVAHCAHLEAVLAGQPEDSVDVGEPEHVTRPMQIYTEQGVVARKDRTPDELITELRESATSRHTQLLADPPRDAKAQPEVTPGGIGWDWGTLLRNRPLDLWMHEQDIRRATNRPGGMESAGAVHSAGYLAESLGFVLGKKVGAGPGTSALLTVVGGDPVAIMINEDGRGERVAALDSPTTTLSLSREDFIALAGGRRTPADVEITIDGDTELGQQVVAAFCGVTP